MIKVMNFISSFEFVILQKKIQMVKSMNLAKLAKFRKLVQITNRFCGEILC